MANSILKLKVETSEYDQKLANAAKGIRHLADVAHKGAGELTGLEKSEIDYIKALGDMETKSRSASGQVRELSSTYKELKVIYDQLNEVEKADEGGKALAASLETLRTRAQEAKAQLDSATISLNDNGEAGKGTSGILEVLKDKFTINIDALTLFNKGLQAGKVALDVAKDAFFQSEGNIDEWGRTVEGAKGAYNIFLDTLNNGNWSNFFSNLSKAIQGGRDLYDVFDRLGSIKSNNAAAIALVQKEIAELRLAKQQGENVDAKLKSATERLKALQGQSVAAGQRAGTQSAFQTIRNGVNSVGGAYINDATIKYAVDRIMKYGQSEFDRYANTRNRLRERGMVTKTQTINDSQGGTYERQYRVFDINALTKEQQKQYALAQAITEGETRIQAGISAYAQAVSEGTSSAREAFKGNRYALQGSGGGGGRSGGGGGTAMTTSTKEVTYASDSIVAQQKLVQDLTKKWNEAGADVRDQYVKPLVEAEAKLRDMQNAQVLSKEQAQGKLLGNTPDGKAVEIPISSDIAFETWMAGVQEKLAGLKLDPIEIPIETTTNDVKDIAKAASTTAAVVGSIGDAFNAIEDPAAKVAGTVMQAIASVALGYAQATTSAAKLGPWAWIAFAATGLATMISTISAIHSSTGYAQGGIIKGNSYSGDNIGGMVDGGAGGFVGLNAGEVVLNAAQQSNLAQNLSGNLRSIHVVGKISGTDIILSADRTLMTQGKQLAVWGR